MGRNWRKCLFPNPEPYIRRNQKRLGKSEEEIRTACQDNLSLGFHKTLFMQTWGGLSKDVTCSWSNRMAKKTGKRMENFPMNSRPIQTELAWPLDISNTSARCLCPCASLLGSYMFAMENLCVAQHLCRRQHSHGFLPQHTR